MFPYLLLLFITIPIIEIYLLLVVGKQIGALSTITLVILTAIIGTAMLRSQNMATLQRFQNELQQGEMPAQALLEGLMLLIGGVLLLTPGFFTDAVGFVCLMPWTRQWLALYLSRRVQMAVMHAHSQPSPQPDNPRSNPHSPSTLEGEYKRED